MDIVLECGSIDMERAMLNRLACIFAVVLGPSTPVSSVHIPSIVLSSGIDSS